MTTALNPLERPVSPDSIARETPEARGLARDGVRLLTVHGPEVTDTHFSELGDHLEPGDLLVINRSATRGAAWDGRRSGGVEVSVHLATHIAGPRWVVELRQPDGTGPMWDGAAGDVVEFGIGGRLRLAAPVLQPQYQQISSQK